MSNGQPNQPPPSQDITIDYDLKVPMSDGIELLTDQYYPKGSGKLPTILVRTPYGRTGVIAMLYGHTFAPTGYHVIIQSCRGTFGSGGTFTPWVNEQADGLATVEWIKKQPFFNGQLATAGSSYLTYVQWAIAPKLGPQLNAMVVQCGMHTHIDHTYPGDAFGLDSTLGWTYQMVTQESRPPATDLQSMLENWETQTKTIAPALGMLPLIDAYKTVTGGKKVSFFEDWIKHAEPADYGYWKATNFLQDLPKITAPVCMILHWYDIFLPQMLADYQVLRRAGRNPYMIIDPGTHFSFDPQITQNDVKETLAWYRAHLSGDRSGLQKSPVRIFVQGANEWRDYDAWPPPGYVPQRWHLQQGKGLALAVPTQSEPDHYRYDPADPTPAIGGSSLSGEAAGQRDNKELEARKDVLVYTSDVLDKDVEVIGYVSADLYVKSSLQHTDFFARLCDVDPSGVSTNICDNLKRLRPGSIAPEADGSLRVDIELWPTAYRFKKGHRIRVQVSSGSHPRFMRNVGSGEPLATAKKLRAADQTVFHDPTHPSAIILPMMK